MSGILDNKRRVLDTFLTQAGRAQLATGQLQIKYASFSDIETYYEADVVSGSSDATTRVYFEACNLPQDNVTFEADDSGLLKPFKNTTQYDMINGQLVTWTWHPVTSSVLTGSVLTTFAEGSAFTSVSNNLLASSIDNLQNLAILSTHDTLFDDAQFFTLSKNAITWSLSQTAPIDISTMAQTIDVNVLDSLFEDARCAKLSNFRKLLPVNSVLHNKNDYLTSLKQQFNSYLAEIESGLISDLKDYKTTGYGQVIDIVEPRPRKNNLLCQFFEQHDNKLRKLDVIDFGTLNSTDANHPTQHVFFVGKVLLDEYDAHTFVHLFTLVFD